MLRWGQTWFSVFDRITNRRALDLTEAGGENLGTHTKLSWIPLTSIRNLNQHSQRCTADMRTAIRMTAAMIMARIVGCVHTMSPIISMTLKYKLLTFKRNVNFAIVLGGELNSYDTFCLLSDSNFKTTSCESRICAWFGKIVLVRRQRFH